MEKQKYFDEVDILTSRPEGMPYDEYKARMRAQKKILKQYRKGEMEHLSKFYPHPALFEKLGIAPDYTMLDALKEGNAMAMLLFKGRTYEKGNDV